MSLQNQKMYLHIIIHSKKKSIFKKKLSKNEGKNLLLTDRGFLPDPALPNLIPDPRAQCYWSEHLLEMEGQVPGSVAPLTPSTIVLFKTSEAVFGSPDTGTLMGTFPSKLFF